MKHIFRVLLVVLSLVFIVSCSSSKTTNNVKPTLAPNQVEDGREIPKDTNFEDYITLIGMTKTKLIKTLGSKWTDIGDSGLEFSNLGIKVWFEKNADNNVSKILIESKNVSFKGAKIGDKTDAFKREFGKSTYENTSLGSIRFPYKDLILEIEYNPKNQISYSACILKEYTQIDDKSFKTDVVKYVGQIDSNSIEVIITNSNKKEVPKVFRFSEELREKFEQYNLQEGDKVKLYYKVNKNNQNVLYKIEKIK